MGKRRARSVHRARALWPTARVARSVLVDKSQGLARTFARAANLERTPTRRSRRVSLVRSESTRLTRHVRPVRAGTWRRRALLRACHAHADLHRKAKGQARACNVRLAGSRARTETRTAKLALCVASHVPAASLSPSMAFGQMTQKNFLKRAKYFSA